MSSEITTIKLKKSTKERIEKLRIYPRETYDEILQKIMNILNICKKNPERAKAKLHSIDKQRKHLKLNTI